MSATSQLTDFNDIFTDLSNRVRIETGIVAGENQAKRYCNIALQDTAIGFGEKLPWMERTATLITQPDYNTGTVTITQGSTALAGVGTLWATNNAFSFVNMRAGGKIVINGAPEIYEIASVTDDTNVVLSSMFVAADVAAVSYLYFEDEYDLDADFLRPISASFFDQAATIELIPRREFRLRYVRSNVPGKPLVASIFDRAPSGDTTPRRRVKLWKPPDEAYMIPYVFVTNKLAVSAAGVAQTSMVADTDEPIIPLQYRHAIVLHALYHWYRDKRDDDRSVQAKGEYTDLMLRITGDNEIGSNRPQLRPRVTPYANSARKPYRRGRTGRHVTGDGFDNMR